MALKTEPRSDRSFILPSVVELTETLDVTEKGVIKNTLYNAGVIFRSNNELAGRLAYDELKEQPVCRDLPWAQGEHWRPWRDSFDVNLTEWAQGKNSIGLRTALLKVNCIDAVQVVSEENRFNPVQDYLSGVVWDGVSRLTGWLQKYLGAPNTPIIREFGLRWMISAVARIMQPGCKADHMLILEGPQGARKSSALRALVPDTSWFTDQIADISKKDASEDLRGKWLVEFSELSAIRKSEQEAIKAFVSRQTEHYREAYGRRSQDYPRKCIFAGTTNSTAYSADPTGARRFWPVKVGTIDVPAIERDRDMLWAEARYLYQSGEKWWLAPEYDADAQEEQAKRKTEDTWEPQIMDYCGGKERVSVNDLLRHLGLPNSVRHAGHTRTVAAIMEAAGWERRRSSWQPDGTRPWHYYPPVTAVPLVPVPCGSGTSQKSNDINAVPTCPTCPTSSEKKIKEIKDGGVSDGIREFSGTAGTCGTAPRGSTPSRRVPQPCASGTGGTTPAFADAKAWKSRMEADPAHELEIIEHAVCAGGGTLYRNGRTTIRLPASAAAHPETLALLFRMIDLYSIGIEVGGHPYGG